MIDNQSAELFLAAQRRVRKAQRIWREALPSRFPDSLFSSHALSLTTSRLLNHLIRPLQHTVRNRQINLFCCLEIYDELELRRLLHRQVSGFGTFQDLVHVTSRDPVEVIVVL